MLERLHRAALALAPWQGLCLLGIAAAGAAVALSIFQVSVFAGDRYLVPAFVALLWLLCLYSFVACFRSLPAAAGPGAGFVTRWRARAARALYWLIAALLLGASLAVVLVSIRFLRIAYA